MVLLASQTDPNKKGTSIKAGPFGGFCCLNGLTRPTTYIVSGAESTISEHPSAESGALSPVVDLKDPRLLEIVKVWNELSVDAKRVLYTLLQTLRSDG